MSTHCIAQHSTLLPYPLSQAHVFLPHVTVLQAASVIKAVGTGFAMLRLGDDGQPEVLAAFLPQLKEVGYVCLMPAAVAVCNRMHPW